MGVGDRQSARRGWPTSCDQGKAEDKARLGAAHAPAAKPIHAPNIAPVAAPMDAPITAPTDHTSLPFLPTEASSSKETSGVHPHIGGKGSAGADIGKTEVHDEDDVEFMDGFKKLEALKTKKSAGLYPRLLGKHESKVRHPEDQYPDRWHGFSPKVKAHLYSKYRGYVENWHKAHPATSFGKVKGWVEQTDWSAHTDEDDEELIAYYDKKAEAGPGPAV